jgi:hydroxymethylpyrimidine pyrophosphatase-like HAD family hydrolase
MGKPFESELNILAKTYKWAKSVDIDLIDKFIKRNINNPIITVGSGGSLSVGHYIATLHQQLGYHANAFSPLDFYNAKEIVKNSKVILISASGRNSDILFAGKEAINGNPLGILGACLKTESKLSKLLSPSFEIWEHDIPSGKDGFLATNSLLAFFIFFGRVYSTYLGINIPDYKSCISNFDFLNEPVSNIDTFSILYGKWSKPVAYDLESKLSEAALSNVQLSDYRNFGHGRHHWYAKRNENSCILALIAPEEKDLALKTLSTLPNSINKIVIESECQGFAASIDLLIKSFFFVNHVGKSKRIDPGKPGVPEFGRKLYNLQYIKTLRKSSSHLGSEKDHKLISRKLNGISVYQNDNEVQGLWQSHLVNFRKKINRAKYSCVIFDYDGTLCNTENKKIGPSHEIINLLIELLENNILIAIATGRGKSVRIDLKQKIPAKYWSKFIIGYYNGTDISTLNDEFSPKTNIKQGNRLLEVAKYFKSFKLIKSKHKVTVRPYQLTFEPLNENYWTLVNTLIKEYFQMADFSSEFQLLESCHSIDIIPKGYSKNLVFNECRELLKTNGNTGNILCVGDKGNQLGNDFKLLSNEFSLSVDKVSHIPDTCWNFLPQNMSGEKGVLYYFRNVKFINDVFKISI